MFTAEVYSDRRDKLVDLVGSGLIIFPGLDLTPRNFIHNTYPFRQDSSFLYYFGIQKPSLVGVIDCKTRKSYVFGHEYSIEDIIWSGPQASLADLCEEVGTEFRCSEQIDDLSHGSDTIHYLPLYRSEQKELIKRLTGTHSEVSLPLIQSVVKQRSIKSPEEIDEIDRAVTITGQLHLEIKEHAREGVSERELVSHVHKVITANGCQPSFLPILTKDGQTLHNHHHHNFLSQGDLLLCDLGAELPSGYCGDMTRTLAIGGFSEKQRSLYQIVLNAQEQSIDSLRPGVRFLDIHLLACRKLVDGLSELGLMKGASDDAVAAGAHTLFFQCGLGHMLGLDVHDMESLGENHVGYTQDLKQSTEFGLKSLRLGKELEEGFVVTIEPGLYFIPPLFEQWKSEKRHDSFINYQEVEKFMDVGGIRLEDDLLITSDGSRTLGKPVPKDVESASVY